MLIQLNNLPNDVTREELDDLCQHSSLVNDIHIVSNGHSDTVFAWLDIDVHSHVGINAICDMLNNKFLHGHHLVAYPSLYSR